MNDTLKGVLILIAIVVGGAVVVFLFDEIAARVTEWADSRRSEAQALDDAGIAITEYRDHLPEEWTPTDEEIEQFLTEARDGGPQ